VTLVTLKKDAPADQATKIAERLVNQRIPDLNSGLRAMRREVALPYLRLLPQGTDAIGKLLPTPSPSPTPLPTPTAAPTQAAPVAAASPTPRAAATSAPVQAGSTVTVTIDNYQYLPPTLNIAAGTRVVWINNDDDEHNMVSETNPRTLESPLIHKNESFSFVFAQSGTYAYFCEPHDFMHAVVVVK